MKKLLLFIAISVLGLGMTSCKDAQSDYMYSIVENKSDSYSGNIETYHKKTAEFFAYMKSLNLPLGSKDMLVVKAKNRETADQKAIEWFNANISKVDNNTINSFAPLKLYLSYQLSTLFEGADSFQTFGDVKEFGDLSLKNN